MQTYTCEHKMEHLVDGTKEGKFGFEDGTIHEKDGDI